MNLDGCHDVNCLLTSLWTGCLEDGRHEVVLSLPPVPQTVPAFHLERESSLISSFHIWVVEDYPFYNLSGKLAHGVLDLALEPPDLMTELACSCEIL